MALEPAKCLAGDRNSDQTTMMSRVAITQRHFDELIQRFTREPDAVAACSAGTNHLPGQRGYLVSKVEWIPRRIAAADDLVVFRMAPPGTDPAMVVKAEIGRFPARGEGAVVVLEAGRGAVTFAGQISCCEVVAPLHMIDIVGPGLPRIGGMPGDQRVLSDEINDDRWSRTAGALGEGTWRRLTELNLTIVGCGRNGSLMATSLTRVGARSITLIDPDQLEPHSLAEGDFAAVDVAATKAEAVRNFAMQLPRSDSLRINGIAESVFALPALAAIKQADLIISCVDNAAARYAVAFLARVYMKPILDVGTGILNGRDRPMGADIRLVLPDRCLLCVGGIPGLESATTDTRIPWNSRRAGSLRSLNQIATGFALRMLEDFIAGRLQDHSWLQLDFGSSGAPRLWQPPTVVSIECPLCSGSVKGDMGLRQYSLPPAQPRASLALSSGR